MTDREGLVKNLKAFCSSSSKTQKKIQILKAVRKAKNYKDVAKIVDANEDYCSTILNQAKANDLVEGRNGIYRQVPLLRSINIDSELRKVKSKIETRLTKDKPKPEKVIIFDLEKAINQLDVESAIKKDCFPLRKPYRTHVGEAYLTLENVIKDELNLDESLVGIDVISEAAKKGLFNRHVQAEKEGLNHLFRASVLWLRNPAHHKKDKISKEEALKMILFADYLIQIVKKQKRLNNL